MNNDYQIKGRCSLYTSLFLIGMDIISQGNLAVTNSNGVKLISFEYPTHGTIDFTSMQ